MELKIQKISLIIILVSLLVRGFLLFLNPISMWADPLARFVPNTFSVLRGDFSFYTPPLLMILNSLPTLFLRGYLLEISWKVVPFIFFVLSLIIFLKIIPLMDLNNGGRTLLLALFSLNVYSLLLSTTIMLEMLVLFFTLCLFYIFEKEIKMDIKWFFIVLFCSALLLYSKQTGYFILGGFGLYLLFDKREIREKIKGFFALGGGFILNLPWLIKNQILYGNMLSVGTGVADSLSNNQFISLPTNVAYLSFKTLEYFYRIPPLEKLNYSGIFLVASRVYYFGFLICGAILSFLILEGILKYGREYFRWIILILPTLVLSIMWTFFIYHHAYCDFGRYLFSFYFILFSFGIRVIEKTKGVKKNVLCLIVILFCLLSIVTSVATSYKFKTQDDELRIVGTKIQNLNGTFICNDMFSASVLKYYSGKEVDFLKETNIIDLDVNCSGRIVLETSKYKLSQGKQSPYEICLK